MIAIFFALTTQIAALDAAPCSNNAQELLAQYRQINEDHSNGNILRNQQARTRAHFERCYLKQASIIHRHSDQVSLSNYLIALLYEKKELRAYEAAKRYPWILNDDSRVLAENLLTIAILARDTNWAEQLKKQYNLTNNILPTLPEAIQDSPGRPIFLYQNGQRHWHNFMFQPGPQILMVTRSGCHFSRQFEQFLNNTPELAKLFQQHSTRIASAGIKPETDNTIAEVYLAQNWPEIDNWGSPTFYFYLDGRLQGSIIGWPKDGRETELIEMLRRIGLTN